MIRILIFDTIPYLIGVVGAVILLSAPFSSRIRASSSRHYLVAMVLVGFAVLAWAALGLVDRPLHPYMTSHIRYLLHKHKDMCAGAAIGIILLEIVSGEFAAAHRRDKELRRQRAQSLTGSPNQGPLP